VQESARDHVTSVRHQRRVNGSELSLDGAAAKLIKEFQQSHDGFTFHRVVTGHANKDAGFDQ